MASHAVGGATDDGLAGHEEQPCAADGTHRGHCRWAPAIANVGRCRKTGRSGRRWRPAGYGRACPCCCASRPA